MVSAEKLWATVSSIRLPEDKIAPIAKAAVNRLSPLFAAVYFRGSVIIEKRPDAPQKLWTQTHSFRPDAPYLPSICLI